MHSLRSHATRCVALVLTALLYLAACSGPGIEPAWRKGKVEAPTLNVLRVVTDDAIGRMGYPIGSGMDPVTMLQVSGWRHDLSPFRGNGFRLRAHVGFTQVEGSLYTVAVRIEREENRDIARPLDPSYAQWREAQDDPDEADVLLQFIRSALAPEFEVSPERRR